jgi:hypothetical protein
VNHDDHDVDDTIWGREEWGDNRGLGIEVYSALQAVK